MVGVFFGFLGALAGVAPPSALAAFFFSNGFWSLFGVLAELAAALAAAGVDACWVAAAAAEAEAEVEEAAAAAPKSAVVSCSSCDSAASPPS